MDQYIGQIQVFGFNFAPIQMAFCNGQILPISQNTALFSLLGTTFGGNGTSTFALPNLQGRTMVHPGQGSGLSPIVWGEQGGQVTQTLTLANLPAHTHNVAIAVNTDPGEEAAPTNKMAGTANKFIAAAAAPNVLGGVSQQPVGQNQAFDITNPYLGLNVCIALTGIYPSRN